MEPTNCLGGAVPDTPTSVDAVPLARFLASQRTVGALLAEREVIMDALIGLVNAAHPYRYSDVCLAHQQPMTPAWQTAYALCEAWEKARAKVPPATSPATSERREIVIPITGGVQMKRPAQVGGSGQLPSAELVTPAGDSPGSTAPLAPPD